MSVDEAEFTECYIFKSTNGITWKKDSGPFPRNEVKIRGDAENRKVKTIQETHRRPDGSFFGTYAFVIRGYKPGEEVPQEFEDDLRRLCGIYW